MTPASSKAVPQKEEQPLQRVFVQNLLLMLVLGVGVSAWILRYTDAFEEFAGLLALGGLFSWLAFVSKLLPDDRLKAMQAWADKVIFTDIRTARILSACILLTLVIFCFVGSVQVQSFESGDRAMRIERAGHKEAGDPEHLLPGGRMRAWFFTMWPFETSVRVNAVGLPELSVTIAPWTRRDLYLPVSFLRPVLLVTPSPKLIDFQSLSGTLEVWDEKGSKLLDKIPFDGRAIWIGCDGDVQIPANAADALREEIKGMTAEADRLKVAPSWFNPKASQQPQRLAVGPILLQFRLPDMAEPLIRLPVTVLRTTTFRDFPQRVKLEAPE